ncbi:hypothetical protein BB559_007452 [Furculomyces boomerangus]|uniref:Ankyrin repeat protein n=1 Tax=Furculomyces boomerangus TaxID=61424 RepID=A0A2T9XX98_9FUNG|nr:hypothetical protein BB559_007452 [Furculomyces boomerangus]
MKHLSIDILSQIFVESNNPNFALVSPTFFNLAHTKPVQADFLLKHFGHDVYNNNLLYKIYPKLAKSEELALILLNKGVDPTLGYPSMLDYTLRFGWTKVLHRILCMYKLVKMQKGEQRDANVSIFEYRNEKHIVEPLIDINRLSRIYINYIRNNGDIEMLKQLLNAHKIRISINGTQEYKLHNEFDFNSDYYFSLTKSNAKNCFELHKLLIENGPKTSQSFNKHLICAVFYNNIDLFNLISEQFDIKSLNSTQCIQISIWNDNVQMLELLLKHGADLYSNINNYLIEATYKESFNIIQFLVNNGADIKHDNMKPVSIAIRQFSSKITKYYFEKGIDPSFLDAEILKMGFKSSDLDFIKVLVENGNDVHFLDDYPIQQACCYNLENVKYLVSKGANIRANNDRALKNATKRNKLDIVDYIHNLELQGKVI